MKKELIALIKQYCKLGWTFEHGSKHGKLKSPTGGLVTISTTASCPHYLKNVTHDIQRIANNRRK